jgi:hypothetical protein
VPFDLHQKRGVILNAAKHRNSGAGNQACAF